jgi:hypothetical protein
MERKLVTAKAPRAPGDQKDGRELPFCFPLFRLSDLADVGALAVITSQTKSGFAHVSEAANSLERRELELHSHSAHATHAARHRWSTFFLFRNLGNHRFRCQHQAGN